MRLKHIHQFMWNVQMIKKRDIAVTTTRLNEFIEDYIRRYPEEWFWLHNRWKWTRRFYGEQIDTPPDVFQ